MAQEKLLYVATLNMSSAERDGAETVALTVYVARFKQFGTYVRWFNLYFRATLVLVM